MTKQEIIDYMYENHVQGDFKIEEMAEDLAHPHWIPVSERLPDPDKKQDVLVTLNYFELEVEPDVWDGDLFWYYGERVIAWMPFPEPYKGDVTDSQDESTPVYLSDLYLCDPDKNTECKKTACYRNGGECIHTVHEKYRRVE